HRRLSENVRESISAVLLHVNSLEDPSEVENETTGPSTRRSTRKATAESKTKEANSKLEESSQENSQQSRLARRANISSVPMTDKEMMEAVLKSKTDLTAKQKKDVVDTFRNCDRNGNGSIATSDLKVALRALGFEPRKNDIKKILEKVDKSNSGRLNFNDFLTVIEMKLAEKDSKDEIQKAFNLFDKDHTGLITFQNLKQIASELGEELNDEEILEMITEADADGDGAVNQDEFFRIMKKTSLY
ncbi:Centrin-2, partial [Orchesella cincta]